MILNLSGRDPQNNHIWTGDPPNMFDSGPHIDIVKITDLQAHNASRCEVLWACRSAIFTFFAFFL